MKDGDSFWFLERRRYAFVWTRTHYSSAAKLMIGGTPVRLSAPSDFGFQDHGDARGPNGRYLCYWCRVEVPKGRRNWCSDECVKDYKLNHDWATIRKTVLDRDLGICTQCGVDTEMARQWWRRIDRRYRSVVRAMGPDPRSCIMPIGYQKVLWDTMRSLGWGADTGRDWWEADHMVARRDGGEDHPRNLRTLCVPCHQIRTAEQRKAWRKKAA
jgi:hypothetical protein